MRSPAEVKQALVEGFPGLDDPGYQGPVPAVTAEKQALLAGAVYDLAEALDSTTPTPIEAGS